jgi:hypothetical protein
VEGFTSASQFREGHSQASAKSPHASSFRDGPPGLGSFPRGTSSSRYDIKFFSDEDLPPLEIVQRLREHYGDGALSQLQVYSGINEVELERTDLANIVSPGRGSDDSVATVIPNKIESDTHMST